MSLIDWIPGAKFVSHVYNNIGKGFSEEGLWGACKVVAKGLSEDTALMVAGLAVATVATGGAAAFAAAGTSALAAAGSGAVLTTAGVATAGAVVGTATSVAAGLDLFGMADLKSEKQAKAQAEDASASPQTA